MVIDIRYCQLYCCPYYFNGEIESQLYKRYFWTDPPRWFTGANDEMAAQDEIAGQI
jgi:hypothetical protein